MNRAFSLLLCAFVAGCFPVSSHHGSDLSKADEFKIERNQTTEKELVDHFGPPMNTITRGDGSKILTWSDVRSEGHVNAATGIPLAGMFMGKSYDSNVTSKSLSATVRDGVVVDFTLSNGNSRQAY